MGKDWDQEAGDAALDFINTLEWRNAEQADEKLNTYADLLDWSEAVGHVSPMERETIAALAEQDAPRARESLIRAQELRELLYRIFAAHAHVRRPGKDDLVEFNTQLSRALQHMRVRWKAAEGFSWEWHSGEKTLQRIVWPIIHAASELMTSGAIERLGECADDHGCGYLFIDQSRNRSRRWCSMESCGNRAKARRHYRRSRVSAE